MKTETKGKRRRKIFSVIFVLLIIFSSTICVFAERHQHVVAIGEADDLVEIYKSNKDILENNDMVTSAMRSIGWLFIKGLVFLGSNCEKLYDTAFGFIDFTDSGIVKSFIDQFQVVIVALVAVSLFVLALIFIFQNEKRPKLVVNVMLFVLCVSCSTLIFSNLNDLSKSFKNGIGVSTGGSDVYKIIDNNLVDLVDLGTTDGKFGGLNKLDFSNRENSSISYYNPGINKNNYHSVNFNEVLNYDSKLYDWSKESQRVLKNKIVLMSSRDGKERYTTSEVYNGFWTNSSDSANVGNEFYYRYKFNFFIAFLQLGALIFVFVTMSYKCVRIIFELVVARLFAYLYSTELSGGEKIKKILVFIRDSYFLLWTTTICIKLFSIFNDYFSTKIENGIVQAIFCLFIAWAVADGPNLVEKLLGMDAGLQSSFGRMVGAASFAFGAGRLAKRATMGAGRLGLKGVKKAGGAIGDRIDRKYEERTKGALSGGNYSPGEEMEKGADKKSNNGIENSRYENRGSSRGENRGLVKEDQADYPNFTADNNVEDDMKPQDIYTSGYSAEGKFNESMDNGNLNSNNYDRLSDQMNQRIKQGEDSITNRVSSRHPEIGQSNRTMQKTSAISGGNKDVRMTGERKPERTINRGYRSPVGMQKTSAISGGNKDVRMAGERKGRLDINKGLKGKREKVEKDG